MNVDKETLSKNRFWIALGVFAPIWLIALIIVLVVGGGKVSEGQKKIDDAKAKLKQITDPKNERHKALAEARKRTLGRQKDKVWAQAWQTQAELMTWPAIKAQAELEAHGYFGQPISYDDLQDFPGKYKAQLPKEELIKKLAPVQANWDTLVRRAEFRVNNVPTVEECWLAQEDLWVQRELLDIVKAAQDYVGKFEDISILKKVEIPEKELEELDKAGAAPPPGAAPGAAPAPAPSAPEPAGDQPKPDVKIVRHRYVNPSWRLDLVLEVTTKKVEKKKTEPASKPEGDAAAPAAPAEGEKQYDKVVEVAVSGKSKLTNVTADRQPLALDGLTFRLDQRPAPDVVRTVPLVVEKPGEKLAPGASLELGKPLALPQFDAQTPIEVQLVADKADPLPKGVESRQRFRSPNWELELLWVRDREGGWQVSANSRIKNINPARRTLPLFNAQFRIHQGGAGGQPFEIPSDPLLYGQSTEIKKPVPVRALQPNLPIQVEQVFNLQTSPVKRINYLAMFEEALSHKLSDRRPLKSAPQFAKKESETAAPQSTEGGMTPPGSGPMAAAPGAAPMMTGMPGMGGGSRGGSNLTPNGLERNRYIDVKDQVRRMPVGLALVVDQTYIQDVLTAVTNSRLRIQITQVQWQHLGGNPTPSSGGAGSLVPPGGPAGNPPGGEPGDAAGGGGAAPATPPGGGIMPPPGGLMPGGMMPPGGTGTIPSAAEVDPNLVELAVYGIASLYERFPPRQTQSADGSAPAK